MDDSKKWIKGIGNDAFVCQLCSMTIQGSAQLIAHLRGSKHRSKSLQGPQIEAGLNSMWHCDTCNTTMTGEEPYRQHVAGKGHLRAAKLARGPPSCPSTSSLYFPRPIPDLENRYSSNNKLQESNAFKGTVILAHEPITKELLQRLAQERA